CREDHSREFRCNEHNAARSCLRFLFFLRRRQPRSTLFPYTTLFRSSRDRRDGAGEGVSVRVARGPVLVARERGAAPALQRSASRSEEHTSELQSRGHLVCRLLLEKKKRIRTLRPTEPGQRRRRSLPS